MEKLKAEIFDLIKQQDILRMQYSQLEKEKQSKLEILESLEKEPKKEDV